MKNRNFFEFGFLIVLLFFSCVVFYFIDVNQGFWWDEGVYLGLAKNLYSGKGYFINLGQESFRPPFFPFLISVLWRLVGISEFSVRVLIGFFAIFSVVLIYFFSKKLYGEEVAFWSALILSTSHMFLFYTFKILTETVFIFFSILSAFFYYLAFEKDKRYFLMAGILMALSFLTRYPGMVLFAFYLVYPLALPKGASIFKERLYWLGIVLFFVCLIPWFWLNQVNYGSPIKALFVETQTVTGEWYVGEWYYYFTHWFEMFGLIGLFVVPGLIISLFKIKNKKHSFILVLTLISLLFFMLIPRKELRYLMHYLSFYVILFSIGLTELRKWFNSKRIIPIVAVFLCFLNFLAGVQMIFYDEEGGKALKEAGIYLSKIAPESTTIMTQNMPVIHYTSGRNVVYFPENESKLFDLIKEKNVSFIVLESREPTYPSYVWSYNYSVKVPSEIFKNFTFVKSFQEHNETFVWVYDCSNVYS